MSSDAPGFWTETKLSILKMGWEKGLSASQIGFQLGTSKNAVVGKARRIHLPARPSPIGNPSGRMNAWRRAKETSAGEDAVVPKKVSTKSLKNSPWLSAKRSCDRDCAFLTPLGPGEIFMLPAGATSELLDDAVLAE